ncbi:hypothetical protein C8R47DRAFT_472590 [Mycena vitilis]|nr:hypothetical protein C8R47DRAFT_472590 [Mycena vitilis]
MDTAIAHGLAPSLSLSSPHYLREESRRNGQVISDPIGSHNENLRKVGAFSRLAYTIGLQSRSLVQGIAEAIAEPAVNSKDFMQVQSRAYIDLGVVTGRKWEATQVLGCQGLLKAWIESDAECFLTCSHPLCAPIQELSELRVQSSPPVRTRIQAHPHFGNEAHRTFSACTICLEQDRGTPSEGVDAADTKVLGARRTCPSRRDRSAALGIWSWNHALVASCERTIEVWRGIAVGLHRYKDGRGRKQEMMEIPTLSHPVSQRRRESSEEELCIQRVPTDP